MSWTDILNEVAEFKEHPKQFIWYRGQKNKPGYEMKSSLFREDYNNIEDFIKQEKLYYNMFKNLGHLYHQEDDWNLLFIMQHHGVPTRLLDWTESFATALFFAAKNWDKKCSLYIWMLKPLGLNIKSYNKAGNFYVINDDSYYKRVYENNFFKNSVALHPIRNNPRIVAQQGAFTIQGNTTESLDNEFDGKLVSDGTLKSIEITSDMAENVSNYLEMSGINSFTLFPDLDGLAEYMKRKYGKWF